ncbi:hypothetical protein BH11MYX4_BH11MYX4_38320 [soil metagenome]
MKTRAANAARLTWAAEQGKGLTRRASGLGPWSARWARGTKSDFGAFGSGTHTTAGALLCHEVLKVIRSADEKRAVDDAWKKSVR